jgi:hypothetical protein
MNSQQKKLTLVKRDAPKFVPQSERVPYGVKGVVQNVLCSDFGIAEHEALSNAICNAIAPYFKEPHIPGCTAVSHFGDREVRCGSYEGHEGAHFFWMQWNGDNKPERFEIRVCPECRAECHYQVDRKRWSCGDESHAGMEVWNVVAEERVL